MASKYANVGPVLVTFLGRPRPRAQRGGEGSAGNQGGERRPDDSGWRGRFGAPGRRGGGTAARARASARGTGRPAPLREGEAPWISPAGFTRGGIPAAQLRSCGKAGSRAATAPAAGRRRHPSHLRRLCFLICLPGPGVLSSQGGSGL